MARAGDDVLRRRLVEMENHFHMRKIAKARRRLGRKLRGIEFDARLDAVPRIVGGFGAASAHDPDRPQDDLAAHGKLERNTNMRNVLH